MFLTYFPKIYTYTPNCLLITNVIGARPKAHNILTHRFLEKAVDRGATIRLTRRKSDISWARRRAPKPFCPVEQPVVPGSTVGEGRRGNGERGNSSENFSALLSTFLTISNKRSYSKSIWKPLKISENPSELWGHYPSVRYPSSSLRMRQTLTRANCLCICAFLSP